MIVHKRRLRNGRHTREEILDAALGLFAERGYHGTAIPDITSRAGVATGTIYRHFRSKEVLVNTLYQQCKSDLMACLMEGLSPEHPPRKQFHRLWRGLARFATSQPEAFAFLELHHHGAYLDQESLDMERGALELLVRLIEAARIRGRVKPYTNEVLITLVWGTFVGLIKGARLGYFPLSDQRLEEAERACWEAIGSPGEEEDHGSI